MRHAVEATRRQSIAGSSPQQSGAVALGLAPSAATSAAAGGAAPGATQAGATDYSTDSSTDAAMAVVATAEPWGATCSFGGSLNF